MRTSTSDFILATLHLLRPNNWIKNSVVFLGVLSATSDTYVLISWRTAIAIISFCLISSAGYIINDVLDADRDRRDPLKRMRPVAARRITARTAITAACILGVLALALAALLGQSFLLVVAAYFGVSLTYSFYLKSVAYIEIAAVVLGFLLRLDAGVAVGAGPREPLLFASLACAIAFLASAKRAHELASSPASLQARPVLVGYSAVTLRITMLIASFSAISLFTAYCVTATGTMLSMQKAFTLPLVGIAFARYLFLITSQRAPSGDPTAVVTTDPLLRYSFLLWVVTVAVSITIRRMT